MFDRDRAADLGVPVQSIAETLEILLAQTKTNEFVLRNRQYDVITALASRYRSVPEQIGEIYVRSRDGSMVALSNLVQVAPTVAKPLRSATGGDDNGKLGPGRDAGGRCCQQIDAIAREQLPPGFSTALGGISREFVESSAEVYFTFVVALVFIYLVLSAQFESFVHPITILVSVPLALLALFVSGNTINLFSQVGIVLLVGLVTKNSILLVEYANQARTRGTALLASVIEAGRTRFRPILMTTVTSICGAMPLLLATGAGAENRRPIGLAVVGGLIFSAAFTLLVVPVFHLVLVGLAERMGIVATPGDRPAA